MTTNHDVIELCKKLRYDLTAAQGKLSDVIMALEGVNVPSVERLPADVAIERQIRNGAVTDIVTLDAELRAARITGPAAATLRTLLHERQNANRPDVTKALAEWLDETNGHGQARYGLVTDERTDPE